MELAMGPRVTQDAGSTSGGWGAGTHLPDWSQVGPAVEKGPRAGLQWVLGPRSSRSGVFLKERRWTWEHFQSPASHLSGCSLAAPLLWPFPHHPLTWLRPSSQGIGLESCTDFRGPPGGLHWPLWASSECPATLLLSLPCHSVPPPSPFPDALLAPGW